MCQTYSAHDLGSNAASMVELKQCMPMPASSSEEQPVCPTFRSPVFLSHALWVPQEIRSAAEAKPLHAQPPWGL